jgi:hypothetical protein
MGEWRRHVYACRTPVYETMKDAQNEFNSHAVVAPAVLDAPTAATGHCLKQPIGKALFAWLSSQNRRKLTLPTFGCRTTNSSTTGDFDPRAIILT